MAKILLVEDHPELRYVLGLKLESMGFTTITATNGREGVERAVTEKPNLIMMNSFMPEMDGTKDIPILASTALFLPSDLKTWIDVGCNDYIIKPFTSDELLRKITALIR